MCSLVSLRFFLLALDGSEKKRLDIGSGSEKSRFAILGARNDVPSPLYMLAVEPSTDQWLCQNYVFVAEPHVYTNTAVSCE